MISDPIRTDDGSYTCWHPEYRETYHARQGAHSEALAKFLEPGDLAGRLKRGPVRLLDVGFGLGVNARAALEMSTHTAGHILTIDSVELEAQALDRALTVPGEDGNFLIQSLIDTGRWDSPSASMRLHLGDLRQVLPGLSGPYDLIFHDPFSPLKNTECWTVEVFSLIRERLHPDGVLLTYSESQAVRSGLRDAGFAVGLSPATPPHRAGTLAAIHLPAGIEEAPRSNTFPFRDPDLSDSGKAIRARREAQVRGEAGTSGQSQGEVCPPPESFRP